MYKVKTFTTPLEIFKTQGELDSLDQRVSDFFETIPQIRVVSVSDTTTVDSGATIGLIRTITYETIPG